LLEVCCADLPGLGGVAVHEAHAGIDTTTGREVLDYRGHAANVRVLATGWEHDNRHVAFLGSDGRLLIWDALTGKTLYSYQVSLLPTPGLLWSPDGRMITLVSQPTPFMGSALPLIEVLQVGPN
jgi:WD40 repeat protein